jgi:hypothetical protein
MLNHFRGRIRRNARKLGLYACACCRWIWPSLPDARSRGTVETAERFADGKASDGELRRARAHAETAHAEAFERKGKIAATAEWSAVFVGDPLPFHAARTADRMTRDFMFFLSGRSDQTDRINLLRCIFGNPFRPVTIDPTWLTRNGSNVTQLARVIYDDRRFEDMPILADALMDAGCHDETILAHCRSAGPHVLGCWVVDVIVGKS